MDQIFSKYKIMYSKYTGLSLRPASNIDEEFVNVLTKDVMLKYVCETWSDKVDRDNYFIDNAFKLIGTKIIWFVGKKIGRITVRKRLCNH